MKKVTLLMLALVCTLTSWAQTLVLGDQLLPADITVGKKILLQAVDQAHRNFFNGENAKEDNAAFSEKNCFIVVEGATTSTFKLQRSTDNKYVAKPSGTSNELVSMTDDATNAAEFNAYVPDGITGGAVPPAVDMFTGVETDKIIRFAATTTSNSTIFLNCNNAVVQAKWATGTGGYSIWYVFEAAYEAAPSTTLAEAKAIKDELDAIPAGAITGNKMIDEDREGFFAAITALGAEETEETLAAVQAYLDCTEATPLAGFYRLVCYKYAVDNTYTTNNGKSTKHLAYYRSKGHDYMTMKEAPNAVESIVELAANGDDTYTLKVAGLGVCTTEGTHTYELNTAGTGTLATFNVTHYTNDGNFKYAYAFEDTQSTSTQKYLHGNMESLIDNNPSCVFSNGIGTTVLASYWYLIPATNCQATLNPTDGKSYATLCTPFAYTLSDDAKAYTATLSGTALSLKEVTGTIPANTGVMLYSEEGKDKVTLTIAEDATAIEGNALKGSNTDKDIDSADNIYVLGWGANGVGFYHPNATTLAANKAYVEATIGGALSLDFGTPTSITDAINTNNENAPIYDLSGRRVMKATHGLYIQGGKKFYIK